MLHLDQSAADGNGLESRSAAALPGRALSVRPLCLDLAFTLAVQSKAARSLYLRYRDALDGLERSARALWATGDTVECGAVIAQHARVESLAIERLLVAAAAEAVQ
jgi:hypothetical protein